MTAHDNNAALYHQRAGGFLAMEQAAGTLRDRLRLGDGTLLWPYVRTLALWQAKDPSFGEPVAAARGGYMETHMDVHPQIYRSLAKIPKGAVLVFGVPGQYAEQLHGKAYDPYMDPVLEEARVAGLYALKLCLSNQPMPQTYHDALVLPFLCTQTRCGPAKMQDIQAYDEYAALCAHHAVTPSSRPALVQYHHTINAYAGMFAKILQVLQPAAVIVECYYWQEQLGLALACRRLGITCAEYQHGAQEFPHIAYCLPPLPQDGFECMPEWFFMWGGHAAHNIHSVFAGQGFHKTAVVGKPNYIAWKQGRLPDDPVLKARFDARIEGRIPICVPLPLMCSQEAADRLTAAIAASPDDWLWLIRGHPLYKTPEADRLHAWFPEKTETACTSALRLHTVLSGCRHMVFAESAAAIEAVALHNMKATTLTPHGLAIINYGVTLAERVDTIIESVAQGISEYPNTLHKEEYISQDVTLLRLALYCLVKGKKLALQFV